jgi:DNA-binding LacI/PurR family transcriptional regulator
MVRIAVAAINFGPTFPGLMFGRLKKRARPDQILVETATQISASNELARARILSLLEGEPKPIALIGICIRPDPDTLAAFRAVGAPTVLIDEKAEGASTVACDNVHGAYLAARHLLGLGRRRLAIVVGASMGGDMNTGLRLEGFKRALAEKGLAPVDVIYSHDYTRKDGAQAMAKLLDERSGVDGVFVAAGDVCATGMLQVARERGVKVPEDVAIVGYDDNALAAISDPPLTTISQADDLMADAAFRLATEETAAILAEPKRVILKPVLVVRRSA